MALIYCSGCDKPLADTMKTCPWCGNGITGDEKRTPGAPTTTALTTAQRVCVACESTGEPATRGNGSPLVFLLLLLFFVVPGFIYAAWWFASRRDVCARCGSDQLVPADSPKGQRILEKT